MSQNFYKNSIIYSIWTNVSRILGLIRDNFCGRLFGTSLEFGAFALAFRIPDLFRRLLEEGALSSIFTPILSQQLEQENRQKTIDFTSHVFSSLMTTITLICSILILLLLGISQLLNISSEWQLSLNYFLILAPYLIFIALISLLSSILNVLGNIFSVAVSPILFNIAWICSLLIAWKFFNASNERLLFICFILTFAGLIQVVVLLGALNKLGWKIRVSFQKKFLPSKNNIKKILAVVFCFAVFQINLFIDGILCLIFVESEHALAALYYSDRIQQLPLAVISISIATASFPILASLQAQGKTEEFNSTLTKSLRGVWYLMLPSTIGLLFLANPLTQQLFSFDNPLSTMETSSTLTYFTAGLIFTSTSLILTRVFYTIGEIEIPLIIGCIVVVLNLLIGVILVFTTKLDGQAFALATSLCSILNACALFGIAVKKFKLIELDQIKASLLKLIVPSLFLTAWLFFVSHELIQKLILQFSSNFLWVYDHSQLLSLVISILGGILVFIISSIIIKPKEYNEIIGHSN